MASLLRYGVPHAPGPRTPASRIVTPARDSRFRSQSDSGGGTDTTAANVTLARAQSDTGAGTDAQSRLLTLARAQSDTAAATETVARGLSLPRPQSDTGAGTETVARALTQARAESDTGAGTETVARVGSYPRAQSDSAPATDTVARALSQPRSQSDTGAGTDAVARTLSLPRTLSEGSSFSDSFTRADGALGANWLTTNAGPATIASNQVAGGTTGSSARWVAGSNSGDQFSQVTYLGGNLDGPAVAMPEYADGAALTAVGTFYVFRQQSSGGSALRQKNVSGATYTLLIEGGTNFVAGDVIRLEYVSGVLTGYINGVQALTWTPSVPIVGQRGVGFITGGADTGVAVLDTWSGGDISGASAAGVTDTTARVVSQPRTQSDSAPATETVARALSLPRAQSDTGAGSDALARALTQARSESDTAAATDATVRALSLPRAQSDNAPATDAVVRSAQSFARSISDTGSGTDVVARSLSQARSNSDSAPATETTSPASTDSRAQSDSAPATDTVARVASLPRAQSDSAPATDVTARTISLPRSQSDSAPATDATVRGATSWDRSLSETGAGTDALTRSLTLARSQNEVAPGTIVPIGEVGSGEPFFGTLIDVIQSADTHLPAGTLLVLAMLFGNSDTLVEPPITFPAGPSEILLDNVGDWQKIAGVPSSVTTTASSGTWTEIYYCYTTVDLDQDSYVATVDLGSRPLYSLWSLLAFSGAQGAPPLSAVSGTSVVGTPSAAQSVTKDDLAIGFATWGSVDSSNELVADTDTTNGSWETTLGGSYIVHHSTDADPLMTVVQWKRATATGSQTYDPTGPVDVSTAVLFQFTPVDATDTVARSLSQPRALSDSAPATDVTGNGDNPSRAVSDSAPATDATVRTQTFARAASDSAPATDATAPTSSRSRALSDSAPATEVTARALSHPRSLADSAPATEAVLGALERGRAQSETGAGTDAAQRSVQFARGVSDDAPATDATAADAGAMARSQSDSAPATDVTDAAITGHISRTFSESFTATDAVAALRQFTRRFIEHAPAHDFVVADGGIRGPYGIPVEIPTLTLDVPSSHLSLIDNAGVLVLDVPKSMLSLIDNTGALTVDQPVSTLVRSGT